MSEWPTLAAALAQDRLSETYRRLRASDRKIAALEERLRRERKANDTLRQKLQKRYVEWSSAAG